MRHIFLSIVCLLSTATLTAGEREVAIKRDFGTLYGTLRTPEAGSEIAAVIIAGSGPTDRNCNSQLGIYTNSFVYLAQALEKQGIASLRYDKRAIGASRYDDPAMLENVSFDDYISDAAAWVEWLRAEGFKKVVFIGHSEGSHIALCAAAGEPAASAGTAQQPATATQPEKTTVPSTATAPDGKRYDAPCVVDGVVSLAGAGFPIDEVVFTQLSAQMALSNPGLLLQVSRIFNSLRQGKMVEDYPRELASLFLPYLQRYWISQMKYKPQEVIRRVEVPVLIVNGDNDVQISVANAEALKKANPTSELLIIPGMTHVLKQSEGRNNVQSQMAAYTDTALPLDPSLAEAVPRFILGL